MFGLSRREWIIAWVIGAIFGALFAPERATGIDIPGQWPVTAPQFAEMEPIAESYWLARGEVPAAPVEAFGAPDEPGVAGRGEVGGPRVWIMESYIPAPHPTSRAQHTLERLELCIIYIHERGHNAGLQHEIFPIMYEPWGPYETPKCERWAAQ